MGGGGVGGLVGCSVVTVMLRGNTAPFPPRSPSSPDQVRGRFWPSAIEGEGIYGWIFVAGFPRARE